MYLTRTAGIETIELQLDFINQEMYLTRTAGIETWDAQGRTLPLECILPALRELKPEL